MAEKLMPGTQKCVWDEEAERTFNEIFDKIDSDHNGRLTFDEMKCKEMTKVLRLMGENPTDSDIKEFMDKLDKDGDGAVTREEFKEFLKELYEILQDPKKSMDLALDVMFKACDIDKNGLISKEEFGAFMKKNGKPMAEEDISEMFRIVDTDGDVCNLTKEELLRVLIIGREGKRRQALQQRKH